ncbi:hypothetical protein ACSBLW_11495 [Thioclava sp. FR2]|uniref:hypothetical protein n=1 Tax=Thioclava sp. FR2 TaxID=3445780 RepID=UPI003EB6E45D
MALVELSHSRAVILRAYPFHTNKMLFDAHRHAFLVFTGVPALGTHDKMKTAEYRVGRGRDRLINLRFLTMSTTMFTSLSFEPSR